MYLANATVVSIHTMPHNKCNFCLICYNSFKHFHKQMQYNYTPKDGVSTGTSAVRSNVSQTENGELFGRILAVLVKGHLYDTDHPLHV